MSRTNPDSTALETRCCSRGSVVATMELVFTDPGVQDSNVAADLKQSVEAGAFSNVGAIDAESITAATHVGEID